MGNTVKYRYYEHPNYLKEFLMSRQYMFLAVCNFPPTNKYLAISSIRFISSIKSVPMIPRDNDVFTAFLVNILQLTEFRPLYLNIQLIHIQSHKNLRLQTTNRPK